MSLSCVSASPSCSLVPRPFPPPVFDCFIRICVPLPVKHAYSHVPIHVTRYCGYVIDSGEKGGEKRFQFHGFRKDPNTDRLCLCLHSACQARYQRVVDANPEAAKKKEEDSKEVSRGHLLCLSCGSRRMGP